MRTGLKLAISGLVTVVTFAAVALFAFPGLFDRVEGVFFHPRMQRRSIELAESMAHAADERHRIHIQRYQAVLTAAHVESAFLSNQSRETITARRSVFDRLHANFPSLLLVRLVGSRGESIHYSTLPSDIVRAGDLFDIDAVPRVLEDPPGAAALFDGDGEPLVLVEPERARFLYSFPIIDDFGVFRGSALFYVASWDVAAHLRRLQSTKLHRLDLVTGGVLVNSPQPTSMYIAAAERVWAGKKPATVTSLQVSAESDIANDEIDIADAAMAGDGRFVLFTAAGEFGRVGLIIAAQTLAMPTSMRWMLLSTAAVTLFLVMFSILNLRRHPAVLLADRIKRFQAAFLREFLGEGTQLNSDEWRSELAMRKADGKTRLTSGMRTSKGRGQGSERLFDRSWDELVRVLVSRANQAGGPASSRIVNSAQIDEIIRHALAAGVPIGTLPAAAEAGGGTATSVAASSPSAEAGIEEAKALEEEGEADPSALAAQVAPVAVATAEESGGDLDESVEVLPIDPPTPDDPHEDLEALDEAGASAVEDEATSVDKVEEMEDFEVAAAGEAPFVDRLRASGKLLTFSLRELTSVVSEVRESVTLEDGVYRIKPDLVVPSRRRKSLFRLAERALSKEKEDTSAGGPQGRGGMFVGGENVDSLLDEEAGGGRDQPGTMSSLRSVSRERRLPVSDAGLDLDQLLRQYPRPKDETTLVRCLVNLSRPLDAVGALLMERRDESYLATQKVGLMAGSAATLQHAAGTELYDRHLSSREGVLLLESLDAIPGLADAFVVADVELVKRIIYLPMRFRDADAYLMLASREAEERWDLPLLVDKLLLHPA